MIRANAPQSSVDFLDMANPKSKISACPYGALQSRVATVSVTDFRTWKPSVSYNPIAPVLLA
jgi:hypothetical protein